MGRFLDFGVRGSDDEVGPKSQLSCTTAIAFSSAVEESCDYALL